MSAVLQRTVSAAGQAATEILAMESSSGKESASRRDLESDRDMNNLYVEGQK